MIHAALSAKSAPAILVVGTSAAQTGTSGASFDLAALVLADGGAAEGEVKPSVGRHRPAGTGKALPLGTLPVPVHGEPATEGETDAADAATDGAASDDPSAWLAGMTPVAPAASPTPPAFHGSGEAIVTRVVSAGSGAVAVCGNAVPPLIADAPLPPSPTEPGQEQVQVQVVQEQGQVQEPASLLAAKQRFVAILVPGHPGAEVPPPVAATGMAVPGALSITTVPPSSMATAPVNPPVQLARLDAAEAPVVRIEPARQDGAAALLVADALPLTRRERRGEEVDPAQVALSGTVAAAVGAHAVAPVREGVLDMRSDTWPRAMVERIDALRDAVDAMDTSIRLHPDALGAVDVSVRKQGDAVHVNLSAEQAATRQLLADAQPRLTELAEARGIRLVHAGIDAGTGGQFAEAGRQQRGFTPDQPSAPRAPFETGAEPDADDISTRIA